MGLFTLRLFVRSIQTDTETFGAWLANYPEIERRVKGTIHQYTLPANAPAQRAGVLGTLALAGDPLWMMPSISEGRREFCIREWTRDPVGWVFISSDSDTRDALKAADQHVDGPVHSWAAFEHHEEADEARL